MFNPISIDCTVLRQSLPPSWRLRGLSSGASITEADHQVHIANGRRIFFHFLAEEFRANLAGEPRPEIRSIPGDLRFAWIHMAGHRAAAESIGMTAWMTSEGRLRSAGPVHHYLCIAEVNLWENFHQLLRIDGLSSFSRHGVGSSYQVESGHQYVFCASELASMRLFRPSPCQSWCPICVKSKGKEIPSKKNADRQPAIQVDYSFVKTSEHEERSCGYHRCG